MQQLSPKERILVPLDTADFSHAAQLVESLAEHVGGFKVGYELGYAAGWDKAAKLVNDAGADLFFDAKLDDIPNTVGKAAAAIAQYQPKFLTVHVSSGEKAIREAVKASLAETIVLGVTVLTSLNDNDSRVLFGDTAENSVVRFAKLAHSAGARGIVCSPKELTLLQADAPDLEGQLRVTPGVRPSWASSNDQSRVMTPLDAVRAGADYLVIGRPITSPPTSIGSSVDAARAIAEELASA